MAANAIPAMLARQMVQRLAAGQGSGAPSPQAPGSGGPGGGDMAGPQIAAQLSELNGADPQMIQKMLNQIKSVMVALYPRSAFTLPGVARNLAQAQKYIDNAIKEAEQGVATQQSVQPPIANGAGQPQSMQPPGLEQFASSGIGGQ